MKLNINVNKPKKAVLTEEILKKYKRQSPEKYAVKYGLLTPAEVVAKLKAKVKLAELKNVDEEGDYIVPVRFNDDGVAELDTEEVARRNGEEAVVPQSEDSTSTDETDEDEE